MRICAGYIVDEQDAESFVKDWKTTLWKAPRWDRQYVIRAMGERKAAFVPSEPVGWIDDKSDLFDLQLAAGDFVVGEINGDGRMRRDAIESINGVPADTWRRIDKSTNWAELDNTPRKWVNIRACKEDRRAALMALTLPIWGGEKYLLAGPAGTQKSLVLNELMRSLSEYTVWYLMLERSREIPLLESCEEAPLFPVLPKNVRMIAIPRDFATPAVRKGLTLQTLDMVSRASFCQNSVLIVDSLFAFAEAVSFSTAQMGRAGNSTLPGGLSPDTPMQLDNFLAIARHPLKYPFLSAIFVHLMNMDDVSNRFIWNHLKSVTDGHTMTVPAPLKNDARAARQNDAARSVSWFPPIVSDPTQALHRGAELITDKAEKLWDLQAMLASLKDEEVNRLLVAYHAGIPLETIWEFWRDIKSQGFREALAGKVELPPEEPTQQFSDMSTDELEKLAVRNALRMAELHRSGTL